MHPPYRLNTWTRSLSSRPSLLRTRVSRSQVSQVQKRTPTDSAVRSDMGECLVKRGGGIAQSLTGCWGSGGGAGALNGCASLICELGAQGLDASPAWAGPRTGVALGVAHRAIARAGSFCVERSRDGEGDDEHRRHRCEHARAHRSLLGLERVRQPGIARPRPPERGKDERPAADAVPRRVVRQPGWPREESNLRTRIRSPPLYPLSYGARDECSPVGATPWPGPGARPRPAGPGAARGFALPLR